MPSIISLKALLFFYYSSMTIIVSYLPVYFQVNGLSNSEIGILLAIGPFAAMVSQPFWGYMTDKYKTSKKIIVLCLISAIFSGLIMFHSFQYGLIMYFTVFVFYCFMAPVGGLGDSLSQKTANQMNISFGSIRMWGSVGFAVMSLLSGFLLAYIGIQYIYLPFMFFLVITLLMASRVKDVETSKKPISLRDALKLLKNKKFILFLFIIMLVTITHRTNDSFLGIYLLEIGGTEAFIGWAWFIGVISEALIFATATYWFRKYHVLTFTIFAAVLYSIRWLVMGLVPNPYLVLSLQMLHGLTFGMFYLCAFNYITRTIPEELQSTGQLLFYSFFFGLSGMIGASIGGQIIERVSTTNLYFLLAFSAIVGAVTIGVYKVYYFHLKKTELVNES
ncbi:MFS transporter [Anaerobacillus alkalidiazotrophicus]|uniref:MFS transporter n=1 Tax=Anaerobacillus alkalidiazotrophicus TaxID=472963 RepID=A0A1S2M2X0_9BACI|nr:MFS transporter [Anaerobacillus alkalidiazotrophicus]OIJ18974.1 MFS transporter [Anaerobacillus alkalidiazotrophicus]